MSAADTFETRTLYTSPIPPQSIRHRIYCAAIFGAALSAALAGRSDATDWALSHARIYTSPDAVPIADGTALTTAPAERFGYAARKGRLARGMDADFVVLDGDPSEDITAFARVRLTVRAGRTIYDAKTQPVN